MPSTLTNKTRSRFTATHFIWPGDRSPTLVTGTNSAITRLTPSRESVIPSPRGRWLGGRAIVSGSILAYRWSFQMQAVNMGDQCSFRGPSTEGEAEHLVRPLGRCPSHPQAAHQTRHEGRIDLEAHPVDPLAQHMPATQHTFDPAEKQLDGPP